MAANAEKAAAPAPDDMARGLKKPDLCYYFSTPGKRCRKGAACTYYHTEDQPTKWAQLNEKRAMQAERKLSEKVKGFGEGFLRSPKVALRAFMRQQGVDDSIITAVQINKYSDDKWYADVHFSDFQVLMYPT